MILFMADNHSKDVRSRNMSRIRSTDSKPEEIVRKFLFSQGFRYRKNDKKLPGKPDIVLPKYQTVIFVNGCFGTNMTARVLFGHLQIKTIGGPKYLAMWKEIRKTQTSSVVRDGT